LASQLFSISLFCDLSVYVLRRRRAFGNLKFLLFAVLPYQESAAAKTNQYKEQNNNSVKTHDKLRCFPFTLRFFLILQTPTANNNPINPVLAGKKVGTRGITSPARLFLDTGFFSTVFTADIIQEMIFLRTA
jgi:hypothetical protein